MQAAVIDEIGLVLLAGGPTMLNLTDALCGALARGGAGSFEVDGEWLTAVRIRPRGESASSSSPAVMTPQDAPPGLIREPGGTAVGWRSLALQSSAMPNGRQP